MAKEHSPMVEENQQLRDVLSQLKQARFVQQVLGGLGKELSLGTTQEFLKLVVDSLQELFGEAYFLVQLADPKTLLPNAVEYRGPLKADAADKLHLTVAAIRKTGLDPSLEQSPALSVSEHAPALFSGSRNALHVPLVSDNQLFGAIQIESTSDVPLGDDDEVLLISLANQTALALRNQRLFEETSFLKNYLENILDHANALIVVTNLNRQILVFNQAMERLLGFQKQQTIGTDLFLWVPKESHGAFVEEISTAIAGNPSPHGVETRMRNRDGEQVQILFHLSALRDQRGESDSLILIGQDITQLRALERQVLESEKMASLGELAAGVVHELNNPLTSISIYAEYLASKLKSGRVESSDVDKVDKIIEGANRIQKLTRDLVSYGRPSSEEPESLQINDVVAQGLSFCEHIIRRYDVVIHKDLSVDLPLLLGNRQQLVQLVINLVTNACQAMEGGGQLTVTTRECEHERLLVSIADTGVGIPMRNLKRIFEPFFTTKGAGQGTGLGLSIVARIVEYHRGEIQVYSSPGAGSTIDIRLPLKGPREGERLTRIELAPNQATEV
jgi:two-component system NtrC family sensor kinase